MPRASGLWHLRVRRVWPARDGELTLCGVVLREGRTVLTRASTSPVEGHTLSSSSPEPFHAPSYTPSSSAPVVGMSSALSTPEARLERYRLDAAVRSNDLLERDNMVTFDNFCLQLQGTFKITDILDGVPWWTDGYRLRTCAGPPLIRLLIRARRQGAGRIVGPTLSC